jgi:hypothetical protein
MAMQHVMSDLDVSGLYQVPDVVRTVNSTLTTSSFSYDPARAILGFLLRLLPLVTVWRVVVLVLVLGNLKNIPLIWHVSISQSITSAFSDNSLAPNRQCL